MGLRQHSDRREPYTVSSISTQTHLRIVLEQSSGARQTYEAVHDAVALGTLLRCGHLSHANAHTWAVSKAGAEGRAEGRAGKGEEKHSAAGARKHSNGAPPTFMIKCMKGMARALDWVTFTVPWMPNLVRGNRRGVEDAMTPAEFSSS